MRLTGKLRTAFAVGFMAGIGSVGAQEVEADGSSDFTSRRRRRQMVERPVEPAEPDGDEAPFCVLDIETTGFLPQRDAIIEIAVIRSEMRDGVRREQVLSELVRPSGNIPRRIRELTCWWWTRPPARRARSGGRVNSASRSAPERASNRSSTSRGDSFPVPEEGFKIALDAAGEVTFRQGPPMAPPPPLWSGAALLGRSAPCPALPAVGLGLASVVAASP